MKKYRGENLYCDQCGRPAINTCLYKIIYNNKEMLVCGKHYGQFRKHHKFLDDSSETQYDSNEYEITNEGVWIYCKNKDKEINGKFLIDLDDLDLVLKKKWRAWHNSYYTGNKHPKSIHAYLMNTENEHIIDHINGNRSDNRRCNLRIVTYSQNGMNKKIQSNNTSSIAGVSWDKSRNKWDPNISIENHFCHLGRCDNFEDAVYSRYIAELYLFGEYKSFRNDNNIFEIIDRCQNKEIIKQNIINKLQQKYNIKRPI